MYDLLTELGLFTLPFPEAYGGADSMLSSCVAVEEFGRVCYIRRIYSLSNGRRSRNSCGRHKEQKERFLPGLANGDLRAAFSLTEPQSGSDVAGIKTRATRVDGGYKLNGGKIWCTNSAVSDFIVVAAKTGESDERGAVNFFIVEKDMDGFSVGRKEDKLGARGVPSSAIFFEDVFIPEENRLGPEGEGFKIVMEALNKSRPIIAARGVGLAQGAIDHAQAFVSERHAFGQTVRDFQGVRWMLADMQIQTEAARGLVYKAATAVDAGLEGNDLAIQAAIAKCHATDTAMQVATDAVQHRCVGHFQRIPDQPTFSRCESAANRRRDQPNTADNLAHYVAVSEAARMSSPKAGLI